MTEQTRAERREARRAENRARHAELKRQERERSMTKAQRAELRAQVVEDSLPSVDVGQFENVSPPPTTSYTHDQVLAAGEALIRGATLGDAEVLCGLARGALRRWVKRQRASDRGGERVGAWASACAYTVERALAIRRMRWQGLAEEGGKGSSAALWMLERRGGREYQPPAQRHEVKRESQEVVVHTTLESAIEHTARELGLDEDELRAQGEYWARAITASGRGESLPTPVTIDASPIEGDE